MKKKDNIHFREELRKKVTIYALVPVIIITLLGYGISYILLLRSVDHQNSNVNAQVSKKIETIISSYIHQADKISTQDTILAYINSLHTRSDSINLYEEFYNFVNRMDIRCNFFLFDENLQPLISSTTRTPEYYESGTAFTVGIAKRMIEMPDQVILAREVDSRSEKRILSIGKAVTENQKIKGYVSFDLNEGDMLRIISNNFSSNVVVTDNYGNVISSTNGLLINKFSKIDENVRDKSGHIVWSDESYYVTKSEILNGKIHIYTLTSIGYYGSIFKIVGIVLVVFFLMMTMAIFFSIRRIVDNKTRAIDEIVQKIGSIQNGNLDICIKLDTKDEFQIIADSFNKMVVEIKKLIEINKEKARENVLSEIKQLESQFNPHFLFNTLEMIKYMVKIEPASVNKIIVGLSTLLRYSINNTISKVTLAEDIEYTKNYLFIQKYRLGERFDYSINVEDGMWDCIVPKLIIQPIIENAIKYGFEKKKSLSIKIKASFVTDHLAIVIYDDGVGMEPGRLEEIREILKQNKKDTAHIGLLNIHRRVQLMYGEEYGLDIMSEKLNGTVVKIILPVFRSDGDYAEGSNS